MNDLTTHLQSIDVCALTRSLDALRISTYTSYSPIVRRADGPEGDRAALEGHTDEEAFGWVIDAIEKLLPRAEEF